MRVRDPARTHAERRISPHAAFALLLASASAFGDTEADGFVEGWTRYGEGRFLSNLVRAEYELKWRLGEKDAVDEGADPFASFGAGSRDGRPEVRARLRAWVDPSGFEDESDGELFTGGVTLFPHEDVSLFLGKDYVIWGKADNINPVDVVNAEDFTQFISQPKEIRKLSNYVLNATYAAGDNKVELVYSLFYDEHELASLDSPWCDRRCQFGQPEPTPPCPNPWCVAAPIEVFDEDTDEDLDLGEVAMRYSSRVGRVDFSVVAHNGFDKFPVWSRRFTGPTSVALFRELERRWRIGGDAAFTWGPVGLRAEALYQPSSVQHFDPTQLLFFLDDDGIDDADQVSWVIGADTTTDANVYLNLQYAANTLQNDEDYFRTAFESLATLQISKWFMDDELELKLTAFYELADESRALSPEAVYRINDDLTLTTTVYLYGGDRGTFFGDQDRNNHLSVHLKYTF